MSIYFTPILLLLAMNLHGQTLADYQWEKRILVLYDNSADQTDLHHQLTILSAEKSGLAERRLEVLQFKKSEFRKGLASKKEWQSGQLPNYLQRKIAADTEFSIFLIGLDGGVKRHWKSPVAAADIFSLIDGMPMRRAEMRRERGKE